MGVFNLSESDMRVLTIICNYHVCMSNGFLIKKSKNREYSHYRIGLEMPPNTQQHLTFIPFVNFI